MVHGSEVQVPVKTKSEALAKKLQGLVDPFIRADQVQLYSDKVDHHYVVLEDLEFDSIDTLTSLVVGGDVKGLNYWEDQLTYDLELAGYFKKNSI